MSNNNNNNFASQNNNNNNNNDEETDVLLQVVLSQLRSMAQQAWQNNNHHQQQQQQQQQHHYHHHQQQQQHNPNDHPAAAADGHHPAFAAAAGGGDDAMGGLPPAHDDLHDSIQVDKVRIALEATGGDVELAASLYWDDYLATRMAAQQQQQQQQQQIQQQQQQPQAAAIPEAGGNASRVYYPFENMPEQQANNPQQQRSENDSAPSNRPPAAAALPAQQQQQAPPQNGPDFYFGAGNAAARAAAANPRLARRLDRDFERHLMLQQQQAAAGTSLSNLQQHQAAAIAAAAAASQAERLPPNAAYGRPRGAAPVAGIFPPNLQFAAERSARSIVAQAAKAPDLSARVPGQPAAVALRAAFAGAPGQPIIQQQPPQPNPQPPRPPRRQHQQIQPVANNQAPAHDNDGRVARLMQQAREAARQLEHPHQVLAARAFLEGESVSVSDDESGGVWKMVGGITAGAATAGSAAPSGGPPPDDDDDDFDEGNGRRRRSRDSGLPKHKRRKINNDKDDKNDKEIYVDGYMSDNDWIWESLSEQSQSTQFHAPTDILWGITTPIQERSSSPAAPTGKSTADGSANPPPAAAAPAAVPAAEPQNNSTNVIADDDAEVDPEGIDPVPATEKAGIPRTWLSAGFNLSDCTTGLVLKPPTEDDLAYFAWQRQASGRSTPRNALPPPYHCRAITAIISTVMALLYSDVTVHARDVNTSRSQRPFAELTPMDRKREFESRLANALSALLLIAAKASASLKRRALKKHETSKDPKDRRMWQRLERKLHLCPTCCWEQDATTGEVRIPEGRDADRKIQIATSYTNIQDLRSYVLSNMKSFTSTGGVALFLETILSIHGKSAVTRMVRQARRKANLPDTDEKAMINCTCEERHKKKMEANPQFFNSSSSSRGNTNATDTTPLGHDCISLELVSLLLTGRVHSTLEGWTTNPLGIGMLSDVAGQVGKGLTRPEKPIWVLRGPTCYSLLWLDDNTIKDEANGFSKKDRPGAIVKLKHWNCWYGQRNTTGLRLVQHAHEWKPPTTSSSFLLWAAKGKHQNAASCIETKENQNANQEDGGKVKAEKKTPTEEMSTALALLLERQKANIIATEEMEGTEPVDHDLIVTQEELERVLPNPKDQIFYPNKYTMWRYDFEEAPPVSADGSTMDLENDEEDRKVRAQTWRHFHKLTDRERLLVESKLGPKIKTILWTRWPRAVIDRFEPDAPPLIV